MTVGTVHIFGIVVAVLAGIPMAILGILPQACVADVSELNTLETGEDRSGMFFAARTFAMKMGQALSMLIYTSVTAKKIIENADGTTTSTVTSGQYRAVAFVATAACLIGALIFFLYNEKRIMSKITELKGNEE